MTEKPKRHELIAARRFVAPTLGDVLSDPRKLPWHATEQLSMAAAVYARGWRDADMLLRVAPWILTDASREAVSK